jgi:predicted alpha/beta-fold hydrolase
MYPDGKIERGAGVRIGCWLALLCAALPLAAAGETGVAGPPSYDFPYTHGLYATIVGFLSVPKVDVPNQESMDLKVDSFRKKMPVKAVIQDHQAPLVVMLLGIDGRADGRLGKLWSSYFAGAGYHVLSFDSTFLPSFIETSGHGVTGNLVEETQCVKKIIAAFLDLPEVKDKVSKIGVVGLSYGAIEALLLGKEAQKNALPFHLDAIQAYSPPIQLEWTGELIDRWFHDDRWNYTLVQLSNELSSHTPVDPKEAVPFSDSLMRAGIAAAFRLGLADVVVRNDKVYKLHLLPGGNDFDDAYVKHEYAETWGYENFIEDAVFPYWRKKMNLQNVADLTAPDDVRNLIAQQPPGAEVILAEDDPFNSPESLAELKQRAHNHNLTVLPRGGHLGYAASGWTKTKLLQLFSTAALVHGASKK